MHRVTVSLATVTALAVAGCSSGEDGGRDRHGADGGRAASPGSASPATGWRPGEFVKEPSLCDAISAETRRRLRVRPPSASGECFLRQEPRETGDNIVRTLTLTQQMYEPSQTGSATDQARDGFRNQPGWGMPGPGIPVRGLGDEAKITRKFYPSVKVRGVLLAVRVRNTIIQIKVETRSWLDRRRSRIQPLEQVEAGAMAAARDVLAKIATVASPAVPTASAPQAAPSPAYRPGEVSAVRRACAPVTSAGRLVPGVARYDISPTGSALGSGCHWSGDGGRRPDLTVDTEVITPSPMTGETASQVAATIFKEWTAGGVAVPGLGDEATSHDRDLRSGEYRENSIYVRRGNLLVYVSHGRWNRPSKEELREEVRSIARDVLAGLR